MVDELSILLNYFLDTYPHNTARTFTELILSVWSSWWNLLESNESQMRVMSIWWHQLIIQWESNAMKLKSVLKIHQHNLILIGFWKDHPTFGWSNKNHGLLKSLSSQTQIGIKWDVIQSSNGCQLDSYRIPNHCVMWEINRVW